MAERKVLNRPKAAPLTGIVQTLRVPVRLTTKSTDAAVAGLQIVLTGGTRGTRKIAAFRVSLNAPTAATGTARLADVTAGTPPVSAVKTRNGYVFENVPVVEPGASAVRVIRITNVRANANGLPLSTLLPSPIRARVTATGTSPLPLSGARQTVALVESR